MQEVGREHHVVTSVPKLRVVLGVEKQHVTRADKAEATEDHHAAEEVHEQARVVQWSVLHSDEAREDWTHHSKLLVDHNPEIVGNSESSKQSVRAVLTRSHFDGTSNSADKARSLCETLVYEILE